MEYVKGLVSIVTPTYNSENYIVHTVDTVLSQTYTDWELIIIDDCSTDDTPRLLEQLTRLDSRIKVFSLDSNQGSGVARNKGISLAQGQYLAFLDSDDLWMPNKLEVQVNYLKNKSSGICHTAFVFVDEQGQPRRGAVSVSERVDLLQNLKSTEIGTSTAVINRELVLGDILFSKLRARQDLQLWISLLGRGYCSHGINQSLVKYRVRNGSVSSNKIKMLYVTLKVYLGIENLSFTKRVYTYICYVTNAIRKRG
ncbi:glycosyltransferase [Vibrio alginolyticus]|nr:glycosyltransferase [Vibrio alginolyticus]